MTAETPQPETADDRGQLSWTAHPAKARPKQTVIAVLIIVALAAAAGLFGGSVWWSLGGLALLVLALNRFLFSSRFTIDSAGVEAQYLIRKQQVAWNRVRRFLHDEHGGYLSTRALASWTDAYRGVHLVFPEDRRPIVERIKHEIREHRQPSGANGPAHGEDESVSAGAVATAGGHP